jgi:phosphatidylglycerophosphatase A
MDELTRRHGRPTLARLIASGCGAGYAPRAPGTAGSLLALLIGALLMRAAPAALPLAALAATLGGLWAIRAARVGGDPGWVVIDEVAGQWIAMLGLARPAWPGLLAAFVLFRLLDIAKPGPIGWADRQEGALGVMADDVIAGAVAAAILWLTRLWSPGLLG